MAHGKSDYERRQRDWDMNPYKQSNGNGFVKQAMGYLIVFLMAVGMTAFSMDSIFVRQKTYEIDKQDTKIVLGKINENMEFVKQYVIERKAIEAQEEKAKKEALYESFKRQNRN